MRSVSDFLYYRQNAQDRYQRLWKRQRRDNKCAADLRQKSRGAYSSRRRSEVRDRSCPCESDIRKNIRIDHAPSVSLCGVWLYFGTLLPVLPLFLLRDCVVCI